ncbi:MAG: VOC family protein [Ignavibacteriales bacterium]|nr:VOC family protein [Ignavibacteriales bacterium]
MSNQYKPEGYNSVSPYIIIDGAQKLIDLLKNAFGAEELRKYNIPNGKIVHSEVKFDDSVIMISDSNDQYPPMPIVLHLYVPDATAAYKKAVEAGFEPMQEPIQKNDPDMRGMVKDFQGNIWTIATQQK